FCGECTRARLSPDGRLYQCHFATSGPDLRSLVRGGATAEQIAALIGHIWQARPDRSSPRRGGAQATDEAAGEATRGER
ncbi:GTP 3',8-cyclase MoaA, partial [Burkholderia pseudomallei]